MNEDPQADWFATGLVALADHGKGAVDMGASILHLALQEFALYANVRADSVIVGPNYEELKRAAKLATRAHHAYQEAGKAFVEAFFTMSIHERMEWSDRLKEKARATLERAE